jgi:nucleoside-diphosphate-sugar epimerase
MGRRKLLVLGARGLVGRAVVERFAGRGDTEVVGVARHPPDFESAARFVALDLRDRAVTLERLRPHRDATHVVYAALYEKPDLIRGWLEPDHIEINGAMFRNLLDAIESPALRHLTLLQGTKAYGAHALGRVVRVPARERDPRVDHANFYFVQEELARERQRGKDWSFTILRPQIVLGVAAGGALNGVATIAAYAALRRALGLPFSHPGHEHSLTEAVDARLIASAVEWAAATPACAGEAFNLTNGDVLVWRDVWPRLAEVFEMEPGPPEPQRLAQEMPKHAELWRDLARRHRLRIGELDELVGLSWQFADATWASPFAPARPALVSTLKARQHGFADCIDTEDSLVELLTRMRTERYVP